MPSNFAFKAANAAHRAVVKVSGGRIGWRAQNMPVLALTTTGRRTGQPRTVMLTSPVKEGDTLVVVASAGGEDVDPAWLVNLRANPRVQVAIGGAPATPYVATVADETERARLWPQVIDGHDQYAGYQRKTSRTIPLVLLTPAASSSSSSSPSS